MIPKAKADEVQRGKNEAAIAALEARIDKAIEGADGAPVSVDIAGVPDVVVRAIRKKYEDGGWKVAVDHGDQREPYTVLRLS